MLTITSDALLDLFMTHLMNLWYFAVSNNDNNNEIRQLHVTKISWRMNDACLMSSSKYSHFYRLHLKGVCHQFISSTFSLCLVDIF